jgi:molybdopterin molybdotransferase
MIPVEDALARILGAVAPLGAETVSIGQAFGRVLAEALTARVTQPPSDVSAMDGYAARAADVAAVPATLRLVGEAPAGGAYGKAIQPGECVRIFTGAPVPQGADTIVLQENVTADGPAITVGVSAPAGKHIRRAGLDFTAGAIGLPAGRVLTARDVGLAAAMNRPWLAVRRRPRVAILASGDEVVMPGDPVGANQIVSSNALALTALVEAWGGIATNLGIAPDRADALQTMAAGARGADLLVTTGGASVGDYDLVRSALSEQGLAIDFWQIAMRPGKPLMFGSLHGVKMLGLPGNPVSSYVCAVLFLRAVLRRMQGIEPAAIAPIRAILGRDLPANDHRADYLRSDLVRNGDGALIATPHKVQDSSMMSVLARAGCLVLRAPRAPAATAGEPVDIIPLEGAILSI